MKPGWKLAGYGSLILWLIVIAFLMWAIVHV